MDVDPNPAIQSSPDIEIKALYKQNCPMILKILFFSYLKNLKHSFRNENNCEKTIMLSIKFIIVFQVKS